jgi:hypothetical protein
MTDDPMTEALTRACIKLGDQAVRIEELEAELATVRLSLGGERDAWQRGAEIAQEKLAAAEARCAELERHRTKLDCRYVGRYAEMSGSHCPPGDPCERCAAQARADRYEAALREIEEWSPKLQAEAEAGGYGINLWRGCSAIARAALAGGGE